MKLSEITTLVEDKISSSNISLADYVTTDSLLPNKEGKTIATNLPPTICSLTHYRKGDVLVANIRPYLKKVWLADKEGGCSSDVLVFRAKEGYISSFLYAVLLQDCFFDYAMKGAKGSKMPRGDKEQIMRYELPIFSPQEQENIGNLIIDVTNKLRLNRSINHNLEAMAKQLYDYWFVQFDFPDENGKPYKSSGGKMVWNEKLKREIPEGWEVKSIFEAISVQYGFPFSTEQFTEERTNVQVVRIRDILEGTTSAYSLEDTDEKYRLNEGDVLVGMDGNFHMNFWHNNEAYLNQRCVRLRPYSDSGISSIQILYSISPYIKAKEQSAKGSTVGHLSDKDLKGLYLVQSMNTMHFNSCKTLDGLLSLIIRNKKEVLSLTKLRDSLLPLLMNGQVSVNYDLSNDWFLSSRKFLLYMV